MFCKWKVRYGVLEGNLRMSIVSVLTSLSLRTDHDLIVGSL
ncbi:unnamed protein product [Linum tenue]|uniref:Uncharacterized protein n=1 Tax=Linum tenue TaxID=586396 RepID=A0AAV0GYE5_9ROSI|nr:unnamed protein product [Linum tenue]